MLCGHKSSGKLPSPDPDSVGIVLGKACLLCDEPIPITSPDHTKYCSDTCKKKHARELNGRVKPKYNACTRGMLSELIASADLTKRGYEVFRALNPGASCDLIAMSGRTLYRIEVRTGHRNENGTIVSGEHKLGDHRQDVIAIVLQDDTVIYRPDIPLEATK